MKPRRTDGEEMPDELCEALSEAGFSQTQAYSRSTYIRVFSVIKAQSITSG
jgi:hypothetical protein